MSILNSASSQSVYRGYEYYKTNKVISSMQISDYEYEGYVQGSNKEPYYVVINTKHPKKSSCDCPVANGNTICKHMVCLFFAISPEELKDYEDWYENDYEDEYDEYEDYYENDEYYEDYSRERVAFVKPIFFEEILKSFVDGLSEKDAIRPIAQENIALYILPKEKMIIRQEDNRCEFLGYKSENTEGCIMAIHAVTEHDDLVIVHIDDSIPIFISLDEYYDEVDNGNARIYQVVDCLLRKQLPDINTNINNAKVVEEDEWE